MEFKKHPSKRGVEIATAHVDVAKPLSEVFTFFRTATNLELITPPSMHMRVFKAADRLIQDKDLIVYKIRIFGIPLRWHSRISDWEHEKVFKDTMEKGPFNYWQHTHGFEAIEGGTRCWDELHFKGPLSWISHPLTVRRQVRGVFRYRTQELTKRFGAL